MQTTFDDIKKGLYAQDYEAILHRIHIEIERLEAYPNGMFDNRAELEIREVFFQLESVVIETGSTDILRAISSLYQWFSYDLSASMNDGKEKPVLLGFLYALESNVRAMCS